MIITRIWDYRLLPYLPDAQLRGQWRECALIAYGLQKNGTPNHLLVNIVTKYSYDEFATYCKMVEQEMFNRGFNTTIESQEKIYFKAWNYIHERPIFEGWHDKEYLRICMANLTEKYAYGVGTSRIGINDWLRLCEGYRLITGEDYEI